jgi:hypothetical protein
MSPHYRPATVADAVRVANNLRPEDRTEVEGLGHSVLALPFSVLFSDVSVAFFSPRGDIGGVAGICPDHNNEGAGVIWMLCTPALKDSPLLFVKQAKAWIEKEQCNYRFLWNLVDKRNHLHHKLLKMLGFKAINVVYPPPYHYPYLEIVKLCA